MKLNKPKITQEKSALEDYVDFLLTDLSNVTSIDSKRNNNKNISEVIASELANNSEKVEVVVEEQVSLKSTDIALATEQDGTKQTTVGIKQAEIKSQPETKKQQAINQADKASNKNILHNNNNDAELITELTENLVSEVIEEYVTEDKITEAESEQEEFKKWDAVLTQEKEQQILAEKAKQLTRQLSEINDIKPTSSHVKLNKQHPHQVSTHEVTPEKNRENLLSNELINKEPDERLVNVEKLLARISVATKPLLQVQAQTENKSESEISADEKAIEIINQQNVEATFIQRKPQTTKDMLPEVFQTLIFNVAQLPLAVPLLKLGGIVHINQEMDITPLVGTPDWFMGLMPTERGNLMVIDTQKYLMPEQKTNIEKDYEYLILLDDTNWALACHTVGDAKNLTLNDIRWSQKSSKRPWFGGMVVEYMSALIEVDELINMLASNISE